MTSPRLTKAPPRKPRGKLWRLIFGIPWEESTPSQKVRRVVVNSLLILLFVVPLILRIFGLTYEEMREGIVMDVIPVALGIILFGGMFLAGALWLWGKIK